MDIKKIYIWGTGKMAYDLICHRSNELMRGNVVGFIDNDKNKWGEKILEWEIYSPSVLNGCDNHTYVYISNSYSKEIINQINSSFPFMKDRILSHFHFEKEAIINRYKDTSDNEIREIIDYLLNNDLNYFNYDFVNRYSEDDFDIIYDNQKGMFYTLFDDKKMYFAKRFNTRDLAALYYKSLLVEQDIESPHRYITGDFCVDTGIVVDAGAAEGMFALSIIDKASMIYLFEPDEEWIEALKYTFEPYRDKVVIVNKGLSNYISRNITTLDEYFAGQNVDFIKMDIEGEEYYALQGAETLIDNSDGIKLIVCTYHQEFAYDTICRYLVSKDFSVEHSHGYMWFDERFNSYRPYTFRRGLIRAKK